MAAGIAAGVGVQAARRWVASRRPQLEPVAPGLRHPVLYLPLDVADEGRLAHARRILARGLPPLPGIEVQHHVVGGADGPGPRLITYRRPDAPTPSGALLWIHGGGLIMGAPEQDHRWCSSLAGELGIVVVSVDYRLAPEHPFPAGLDDCVAAWSWMHGDAHDLRVDPARVAIGGVSAGGGLAAAVCQRVRDQNGPSPCFQLLNYPMLDDRTVLQSDHRGRGELLWTVASNAFAWTAYLGHRPLAEELDPYAAPSRCDDLSGLPPAWIGVGDLDLFHPEDVDYAERLQAAGVECELREVPGMYHGADQLAASDPSMQAYRRAMVGALRERLT